jgi:FkbH-like protein
MGEVNLGLQSAVFIDDNPVERARVREALPEVLVPDWPEDPRDYTAALQALRCFDIPSVTQEDVARARMYVSERQRSETRDTYSSLDDWLGSLETVVTVERPNESNRARILQLLNKTNQMNLTTRRLTEAELDAWIGDPAHELRAFRVSDRFGDSGLTGIASLAIDRGGARIVDYILSCRVMGRKVEETVVAVMCETDRERGVDRVTAEYLPTAKNKPCLRFWRESSGFEEPEEHVFVWNAAEPYETPSQLEVVRQDQDGP